MRPLSFPNISDFHIRRLITFSFSPTTADLPGDPIPTFRLAKNALNFLKAFIGFIRSPAYLVLTQTGPTFVSHTVMIYMDPRTGAITGIIDWGAATFRPLWGEVYGVRWLGEDPQRFTFGSDD